MYIILLVDTTQYQYHLPKGPPYEQPKYTSITHNSTCTTPIDTILSVLESGERDLPDEGSISLK